MDGQMKLAGVLWLIAAILAVVVTVVFRDDALEWVVTIMAGVAAAIVGVLILSRPSAGIFAVSKVAGVGWLVLYAALIIKQRDELAAWGTDVFLAVLGVGAAILANRAFRSSMNHTRTEIPHP
jgi:uncharacterized membrane protein HdeD (DUF308 family)